MPSNSNEKMRRAMSFHQNGDLHQAEKIYEGLLEDDPKQSDAQYLIGVIALQKDNFEAAIKLIDKAIKIDPNKAHYYADSAQAYAALNNNSDAIDLYKKAIEIKEDYHEAHNNIGNLFRETGNYEQAIIHLKKAIDLDNTFAIGYYNLGLTYYQNKDYKNSAYYYNKAIETNPGFYQAYNNLGIIHKDDFGIDTAASYFKKAISINPEYAEAYLNLGDIHLQYGNANDALRYFKKILKFNSSYVKAYIAIANVMRNLNNHGEAILQLNKSLAIEPNNPNLLDTLGQVFTELGMKEKAIESFEKALEINPNFYETIYNLTIINPKSKYSAMIDECLKKDDISENEKMHLHFSSGIILDKLNEHNSAFSEFNKANQIKRNNIPYKSKNDSSHADKLIAIYTKDYINKISEYSIPSDLPIFIIGMPRSGTSLVEQIISTHNNVYGAGELNLIDKNIEGEILKKLNKGDYNSHSITNLTKKEINLILNNYISELQKFSKTASRITDKLPYNYLKIGLIKSLLPNSKIILCKRNALDNCLSIFFSNFPSPLNDLPYSVPLHDPQIKDKLNENHCYTYNAFSYDLLDIGKKYLTHEKITTHWKNIFPNDVYEVQYEKLIVNQEKISKELINHIGLEWDPNCLNFYKNKREVKTRSFLQVRQPMYSSSVDRWKKYKESLNPLIDILNLKE